MYRCFDLQNTILCKFHKYTPKKEKYSRYFLRKHKSHVNMKALLYAQNKHCKILGGKMTRKKECVKDCGQC